MATICSVVNREVFVGILAAPTKGRWRPDCQPSSGGNGGGTLTRSAWRDRALSSRDLADAALMQTERVSFAASIIPFGVPPMLAEVPAAG